jgi:hypothetical protein
LLSPISSIKSLVAVTVNEAVDVGESVDVVDLDEAFDLDHVWMWHLMGYQASLS